MTRDEARAKLLEQFEMYADEGEDGDEHYFEKLTLLPFLDDFGIYLQAVVKIESDDPERDLAGQ